MLGIIMAILAVVAVASFAVAAYSFSRVILLMPKGRRLAGVFTTGWWQFDRITELCGPAAHPHVRRYIKATMLFLACVIGGIGLSIVLAADRINGTSQAVNRPINDYRVLAARHELAAIAAQDQFSLPLRQES